jgi:hypothetical protein
MRYNTFMGDFLPVISRCNSSAYALMVLIITQQWFFNDDV